MKIFHYIPSMDRSQGGVAAYLSTLSGELGRRSKLVIATCVQPNNLPMNNCKVVDLEGFSFTDAGLGLSLSGMKRFADCCNNILDREQPDIVHINGIWSLDRWIMQRQALKRGIKTYIMPHGMLEPWILHRHYWTRKLPALLLYQRKALKKAVGLIATAESERRNIVSLNVNANVQLIANGIDMSGIIMKSSWKRRKKILYVSRIHVKKGIELLIETAAGISEHLKDYEIVIAGEGDADYVARLKAQAQNSLLNMRFVGGVYGEEKWRLFQEADFFVLPTYSENFGYVIAEALACGTPVITTKDTPWEAIDGICGCWIERSEKELAKAILMMIGKTPAELECMGRAGRQLIENNYSAQKMAEQLMKVYKWNDNHSVNDNHNHNVNDNHNVKDNHK